MKDLLIVTTYNRPESLAVCLEHIARVNLRDVDVVVSEDARPRSQYIEVEIREILSRFDFSHVQRFHCINGYDNIYQCLHEAMNRDFVYAVEDDQIVESDFIHWHRQAQFQFSPFITCAENPWSPLSKNPAEVGISHSDSLIRACCLSQENLRKILNPEGRYRRHFEEEVQNYLIRNKLVSIFPMMPRAFDLGVKGVNLGGFKPTGTLDEKITQLRARIVLQNPQTLGSLIVGCDRRGRWQTSYDMQAQWGF